MIKTPVFASTAKVTSVIPARFALFVNVFLLKPAMARRPQIVRSALPKVQDRQPRHLCAAA